MLRIEAQNPVGIDVDFELLRAFEDNLDPAAPERHDMPCQVLGYGEISTVFALAMPPLDALAFKRISIFLETDELKRYLDAYRAYHWLLQEEIGLQLPANGYAAFTNAAGRPVFYSIQHKYPKQAMGQKALHRLPPEQALLLVERAVQEAQRVWDYNTTQNRFEVAIDGQISNWAIATDDPQLPVDEDTPMAYIDTSTPLFRINGVEQLQAELFLRPAASFLAPILRRAFLDDVLNRYYDPRQVVIDLIANIFKEQEPALIPPMIAMANRYLTDLGLAPVTLAEVRSYYQQDRFIWQLYGYTRRLDRQLHRLRGKTYPYILPGRVQR